MSAPCHRRFSRSALAAYVTERRRFIEKQEDDNPGAIDRVFSLSDVCRGKVYELQRLYDHFELGKERRRPQGGTLTRYDPK